MRTRNLAIVFAGICGYAERLGTQTWEQSQRMLRVNEALLDPVIRAFRGRRIKQIGGTLLFVFESPTDAAEEILFGWDPTERIVAAEPGEQEEPRRRTRAALLKKQATRERHPR